VTDDVHLATEHIDAIPPPPPHRADLLRALAVLRMTGAKPGAPREAPLAYFTDGDNVILVASSYGRARHPSWYYNLLAHPECELFAGAPGDNGGGRFVARVTEGEERDRLYALAVRHYVGYANYAANADGVRTIPVLRLTPAR
jgi:deazaflavin-dependent oxidoreductase (nitroreductase family)